MPIEPKPPEPGEPDEQRKSLLLAAALVVVAGALVFGTPVLTQQPIVTPSQSKMNGHGPATEAPAAPEPRRAEEPAAAPGQPIIGVVVKGGGPPAEAARGGPIPGLVVKGGCNPPCPKHLQAAPSGPPAGTGAAQSPAARSDNNNPIPGVGVIVKTRPNGRAGVSQDEGGEPTPRTQQAAPGGPIPNIVVKGGRQTGPTPTPAPAAAPGSPVTGVIVKGGCNPPCPKAPTGPPAGTGAAQSPAARSDNNNPIPGVGIVIKGRSNGRAGVSQEEGGEPTRTEQAAPGQPIPNIVVKGGRGSADASARRDWNGVCKGRADKAECRRQAREANDRAADATTGPAQPTERSDRSDGASIPGVGIIVKHDSPK